MLAIIIIIIINCFILDLNISFSLTPSPFLLNPNMMHYKHTDSFMYSICIMHYSYIALIS